jgi:hypothetical protein
MQTIGDIDGDGIADFVYGSIWMSGAEVLSADTTSVDDMVLATMRPSDTWEGPTSSTAFFDVGDLTGDGVPDLVTGTLAQSSSEVAYQFLDGTLRGDFSGDDAFGSWVGDYYGNGDACDLDGDGRNEITGYAKVEGEGYRILIRGPTTPPAPYDPLPDDILLLPFKTTLHCGSDLTGDGIDDLAFMRVAPEETDLNTIGVIPGFAIPWDDPFYW